MNTLTPEFIDGLVLDLSHYQSLCEEVLTLTTTENRALAATTEYEAIGFNDQRRSLMPRMDSMMAKLRLRRLSWQQVPAAERERCEQVRTLFTNIQNLLMKILLLDRENQQAMLKRGLVPARHLPAAPVRPANFVASVYARNSHA